MVKFYESSFDYEYPFPAVSLAYFLRYPNPYATHVLSTDVIDRHLDPDSQRLTTTRLHLKKSKIPLAVLKLLPKGILGGGGDGGQSYILEKSVIDVREGWMRTETKNLEWTGILSVVERQLYYRISRDSSDSEMDPTRDLVERTKKEGTAVTTTVTLLSRFGQVKRMKQKHLASSASPGGSTTSEDEEGPKKGLFSSWTTSSLQRTIEMMGLKRTTEAMGKSKEGMNVVLSRLRSGGLKHVLEGMQQDRQRAFGQDGPWKQAWRQGQDSKD